METTYTRTGIAVIGAGVMGKLFSRIVTELPNARLVGVCDIVPDAARSLAEQRGGVPWYDNHRALLARDDVQAAIVCTTDGAHLEPSLAVLRAGKHLFVEKPLATTSAEAEQIIAEADKAGVTLLVGHCLRFDPRFILAKRAIDEGRVGAVQHIHTRRFNPFAAAKRLGGRTSVAFFLAVHDIDIVNWYTGAPLAEVYALAHRNRYAEMNVDDTILALLRYGNGVTVALETSWALPTSGNTDDFMRFEVFGDKGVVRVVPNEEGFAVFEEPQRFQRVVPTYSHEALIHGRTAGVYRDEVVHFLDCVAGKAMPAVTGQDGLAAVRVVEAIHRSLERQQPVRLGG